MNYDPNTTQWCEGDLVLHDADAKEPKMLMKVTGYTRDGLCKTQYLFTNRRRKIWKNEIRFLHNPETWLPGAKYWSILSQDVLEEFQWNFECVRRWNHYRKVGQVVQVTLSNITFETVTTGPAIFSLYKGGSAKVPLQHRGEWSLNLVKALDKDKPASVEDADGQSTPAPDSDQGLQPSATVENQAIGNYRYAASQVIEGEDNTISLGVFDNPEAAKSACYKVMKKRVDDRFFNWQSVPGSGVARCTTSDGYTCIVKQILVDEIELYGEEEPQTLYYIGKNRAGDIVAATTFNPNFPGDCIPIITMMSLSGLTIETTHDAPKLGMIGADDDAKTPRFYMEYAVQHRGALLVRSAGDSSLRPAIHEEDDDDGAWFQLAPKYYDK